MSTGGTLGTAPDVDALVDGLFALPLEQFVVARTAAAKEIKASGDAVGAARGLRAHDAQRRTPVPDVRPLAPSRAASRVAKAASVTTGMP